MTLLARTPQSYCYCTLLKYRHKQYISPTTDPSPHIKAHRGLVVSWQINFS